MRKSKQTRQHPASFRDPSGFLFERNGKLFRQVNRSYQADYDHLIESGLYSLLVEQGDLLPHSEGDEAPLTEESYKVIDPEPVDFISYPYEWSFSEWKDAALTTLRVHRIALEHGMALKDASAFNVQFHRGRPLLIDTLSFEMLKVGEPWIAYRQFCQHFLAPLALMSQVDIDLAKLMRVHIEGIPLSLASRLLPRRTRLKISLLVHIHWHANAQQRYAGTATASQLRGRRMDLNSMLGLADSLEGAIHRLNWKPATVWSDYEQTHAYSEQDWGQKLGIVDEFLNHAEPDTVWDLGANVGRFSRRASDRGIPTMAFDFDPGAVELSYLRSRNDEDRFLLPLVVDLTNPSPALGWGHAERMSLQQRGPAGAIMALALIHHLAISNNVPLDMVAEYLSRLCKSLLIEFIPKEDPQVQRLLASREDIFPAYHRKGFEAAFEPFFATERSEAVGDSNRRLYWMDIRP